MQDGARAHTEGTRYLGKKKVRVLADWPPRSPDLNVIETIWGHIQARVSENAPSDERQLKEFWQREWEAIPQDYIDGLVRTFTSRLRECVRLGGRTIRNQGRKSRRAKRS